MDPWCLECSLCRSQRGPGDPRGCSDHRGAGGSRLPSAPSRGSRSVAAGCEAAALGLRRVWAPQEKVASPPPPPRLFPHPSSQSSFLISSLLPSISASKTARMGWFLEPHCVPGTLKALWTDFLGGPVAKTVLLMQGGLGSIPGQGTRAHT